MARPDESAHRLLVLVQPAGQDAADAWFESRGLGPDTFTTELYTVGGDLAYYCADMVASQALRGQIRAAFSSGRRQNFDRNHLGEAKQGNEQTRAEITNGLAVEFRPAFD